MTMASRLPVFRVVVLEPLAQPAELRSHHRFNPRIERCRPLEDVQADGIFVDLFGVALERVLHQVAQQLPATARGRKMLRPEQSLQGCANLPVIASRECGGRSGFR